MKSYRKSRIGMALAAALGAAVVAPNASAVNVANDGVGDVATAPYYTVREGWETLINLTNTRPYPVVVKVRIHEYRNSRDVRDFLVALSAYDVWTALLTEGPTGPQLNIIDEDTCTVPPRSVLNGIDLSVLGFSGLDDRLEDNADDGPVTVDRMREGYIEFVVMGHTGTNIGGIDTTIVSLPEVPVAAPATTIGNDIQDHDCAAVDAAFSKTPVANIIATAQQFGEPINALKFNFRLLNVANGTEAGNVATTWANFWNGTTGTGPAFPADFNVLVGDNAACTIDRGAPRRNNDVGVWTPGAAPSCQNLITAQAEYDFLDPSVNDAYPAVGNFWDDTNNSSVAVTPGTVDLNRVTAGPLGLRGVDALSATIQRSVLLNEWSTNDATGTDTEWVVTFPTKYFYVDQGAARQFAVIDTALYTDRPDAQYAGIPIASGAYPPFAEMFSEIVDGTSCNEVSFARFNREQESADISGGTIPSPAPPQARTSLCFEANVLSFDGPSAILGAPDAVEVDLGSVSGDEAGWMKLRLDVDTAANPTNANPNALPVAIPGGLEGWYGLPAVGFLIKQRDFGDPDLNYTSSVDHGYERRQ